jgi:hypothetical protein
MKKLLYDANGKPLASTFVEGEPQTQKGFFGTIATYAQALSVDPLTAFERIFTGQKILRLDNGTIVVERNTKKETDIKKQLGGTTEVILDHIKSFELGGDNSSKNMWLIPKDQSLEDDKVENYLGNALRKGLITGREAQEYELRYKKDIDSKFIDDRTKKIFDSVGDPLTFEEIKNLIKNK